RLLASWHPCLNHQWGSSTRRRNTGRWPVRPAGILPAVVHAGVSSVKLRWAHRLESLCSVKWSVAAGGESNAGGAGSIPPPEAAAATTFHSQHGTAAFGFV